MSAKALEGYVIIAFVVAALAVTYTQGVAGTVRGRIRDRRAQRRVKRAELAAIEASLDDPAFDPARVEAEVASIVAMQAQYRQTRDPAVFGARDDAGALLAWARQVESWLDAEGSLDGVPEVRILGVVNRDGTEHDSVEAWVRIALRGSVTILPHNVHRGLVQQEKAVLEERWLLGRRGDGWGLLQATDDPRSPLVTARPLIPNAWDDERRLRGESLREIATDERPAPPGIADGDLSPVLQLQDLAVADSRYSPDVVEAVIDRLLEAWEEASRGREVALAGVAQTGAATDLVHPPQLRSARLIVHDIERLAWMATAVHDEADPPTIEVSLRLGAIRYLVDERTREHIAGAAEHRHEITLSWRLRRVEADDPLWRLEATTDPSLEIAGYSSSPTPAKREGRVRQLLRLLGA